MGGSMRPMFSTVPADGVTPSRSTHTLFSAATRSDRGEMPSYEVRLPLHRVAQSDIAPLIPRIRPARPARRSSLRASNWTPMISWPPVIRMVANAVSALPRLAECHQFGNAGMAIAAALALTYRYHRQHLCKGLATAVWPAMERLARARCTSYCRAVFRIWLDAAITSAGRGAARAHADLETCLGLPLPLLWAYIHQMRRGSSSISKISPAFIAPSTFRPPHAYTAQS